jgi:hypothetical protein
MADFIQGLRRRFSSGASNNTNAPTVQNMTDSSADIKGILMSIGSVLLAVLIIAIIIHYTIYPIFKIKGKGFIPVPGILKGISDGEIYWTEPDHGELDEINTILNGDKGDTSYTVIMDMYFDDLKAGSGSSNEERPVFMRYSAISDGTKPVNYSLGMFLDHSLNDLLVKVRTTKDTEVIKIKNIPSKTPIRVGAIVTKSYFEVYYNGRLIGTRNLKNPPIGSVGKIFGNPGNMPGSPTQTEQPQSDAGITLDSMIYDSKLGPQRSGNLGNIINLHIWNYALGSDDAKNTTPAMPKVTDFIKG